VHTPGIHTKATDSERDQSLTGKGVPNKQPAMNQEERRRHAHDMKPTLRVGKAGVDAVASELRAQLEERELVKVKFLRSSRGSTSTDTLAEQLAKLSSASVYDIRGHTAVFTR
jgi:RNA-binding protein